MSSNMENIILYTIVFFGLLMKSASGLSATFTLSRTNVEIRDGGSTCISNCSHISAKGNRNLICSVEECKFLNASINNSQRSEVEKNMIHFEKYFDELEDKYKLALYFKWSPVDNVSMERTKGYLLNISDGLSTYSTCYSISTPMEFHYNAHDLFYNDCFGKVPGTVVQLDSKITVNITTLPLWDGDPDDGKIMFVVEVPNCNREELDEFSECLKSGGRPTTLPCSMDCNTYSAVAGVRNPVSCTLSKSSIYNIGGKERCEDVNKDDTGTPSAPKHLNKTQEWYKFYGRDGNVSIALNFSWTPRLDSSLESLHGYYLEITPKMGHAIYYNKCYSVHTNLTLLEHSQTEFFHDCYGRGLDNVEPGTTYHIHLNSLPSSGQKENFDIKVPDCDDERVQDVMFCMEKNKEVVIGTVDEVFCHNRSVKYTYHVSHHYGDFADVFLCERSETMVCKEMWKRMQDLSVSCLLGLEGYVTSVANKSSLQFFQNTYVVIDAAHAIQPCQVATSVFDLLLAHYKPPIPTISSK